MIKTFFIDYDITIKDQLIEILKGYTTLNEWMLSHEEFNSKGEHKPHYHFYLDLDNIKTFNNIVKNIKERYDLINLGNKIRQETGKKGYRNYGVVKKDVYDPEYFKKYICKDHNVWGSMSPEKIQSYIDASFKANNELEFKEKLYQYVLKNYEKPKYNDMINQAQLESYKKETNIKLCIMEYMRENDSTITKIKVNNHFNYFLTKNIKFSITDIFKYLQL